MMTRPVRLLVRPSGANSLKIGAMIITSGNIWVTSIRPTIQNFPAKTKREKA